MLDHAASCAQPAHCVTAGKQTGEASSGSKPVAPTPPASQSSRSPASASKLPINPPDVPPITPGSKGHIEGQLTSPQFPSMVASAPGAMGRVSSQTRFRPTGLPLARKGSTAGLKPAGNVGSARQGNGTEMSVSEMMQWLDSKLAQAVPTQAANTVAPAR